MGDTLEIFGKEYTNVAGFKAKDGSGNTLTYTRGGGGITPTGTINITTNGTHDVTNYASANVNVPIGKDIPVFTLTWNSDYSAVTSVTCNKTYAECLSLMNDNNTVGALLIPLNSSGESDGWETGLQFIGALVNEQLGERLVWSGSDSGQPVLDIVYYSSGNIEVNFPSEFALTLNATANGTYNPAHGVYTEVNVNVPASTPTLQSKTATPTESAQTITADSGYDGLSSVAVGAISNTYIGSGITRRTASDLYGIYDYGEYSVNVPKGYYDTSYYKAVPNGTAGTPTAAKGTVSNHSVTVTPSVTNTEGYITGGTKNGTAVTVSASELVSGSETKTVNDTYDVTNLAELVVNVPTGTARSSSDLTVSGATVTVPAGLYSSQATKSVASGSAGTPTATKGTVSNHSITVTPSVTNTTGYITGGTKSGTGVTVSASELVSGSQTITANGNNIDVTNLASVNVALTFSTIYTGTSTPSSSTGSNGDIYIKTS